MSNSNGIYDREALVAAGLIRPVYAEGKHLGYEWSRQAPDNIDERASEHLDRLRGNTKPQRILDLGCAYGARMERYAEAGVECIGVDIVDAWGDIQAINTKLKAQQKPEITFIQSDIRKLEPDDFAADEFAVINCSQVIHFMDRDDIIHLLRFIKKVASPTTLICLSFDTVEHKHDGWLMNANMLWDERLRVLDVMGYTPTQKLEHRYYTVTDIAAIIEKLDFKLHQTLHNNPAVAVMVASTSCDKVFEQRPAPKGIVQRLLGYVR